MGKSHQLSVTTFANVYDKPIWLIYINVWGPAPVNASNGGRY